MYSFYIIIYTEIYLNVWRVNLKDTLFSTYFDKFLSYPLYIKQAMYMHLRSEFEEKLNESPHSDSSEYCLYVPSITNSGKEELKTKYSEHSPNLYKFLADAANDLSMVEIALHNFWSLEEAAMFNAEAVSNGYVVPPERDSIVAMMLYCAARIRIGEYLLKRGTISEEQNEFVIQKQKELEKQGKWKKFVELLVEEGFVTQNDTKAILYVKDECKKRFEFMDSSNQNALPDNVVMMDSSNQSQKYTPQMLEKIIKEHKILKTKMKAIVAVLQGK